MKTTGDAQANIMMEDLSDVKFMRSALNYFREHVTPPLNQAEQDLVNGIIAKLDEVGGA